VWGLGWALQTDDAQGDDLLHTMDAGEWDAGPSHDSNKPHAPFPATRRRTTRATCHVASSSGEFSQLPSAPELRRTLVQLGGHELWVRVMRAYAAAHNTFTANPAAGAHVEREVHAVRNWVNSVRQPDGSDDQCEPALAQFMVSCQPHCTEKLGSGFTRERPAVYPSG
jgi:hypothetical protein